VSAQGTPGIISREPLFTGAGWDFDTLLRTFDAIERVAVDELGLDVYPTRLEVITSEQMLDAYAATGMPVMYPHWSFGKRFAQQELLYRKGYQSLALEIVINADPSICYIMEENTMATQATVIAHAAMGHNHFFKNNQVFQAWTTPDTILDDLRYARGFVKQCEDRHGRQAVERVLDAAHTLFAHGVGRERRGQRPDPLEARDRVRQRRREQREAMDELWLRTVPHPSEADETTASRAYRDAERRALGLPEENILLFLEVNAPLLEDWQRELLCIVRQLATYFEPQRQTKMMNEGCATWCHFEIMNRLRDRGEITEGAMLEFLHLHAHVVAQPEFDQRGYPGINPYALGFAMMRDIARICTEPSAEDQEWFPDIAGKGDATGTLRRAWAEFRDESFVRQYLSPKLIRDWRMFRLQDDAEDPEYLVEAIHDDAGYRKIRSALADHYDPGAQQPRIEVVDADMRGDRTLELRHWVNDGQQLDALETRRVLRHVARLWGYEVRLTEVEADGEEIGVYETSEL